MLIKKKIKVGLDARTIFSTSRRGTGKNLIDLYKRIPLLEPLWEFYLYCYPNDIRTEEILPNTKNIKKREIDINGYRFNAWEQIRLPIATLRDGVSLLHCPAQTAPYYSPCVKVVTIHDLIPLKINDGLPRKKVRAFQRNIQHSLRTAKKIITVSEYSKKDILQTFKIKDEEKIEVIYWAAEDNCRPLQDKDKLGRIREKHSINQPYIFAFGASSIRKNTLRLLKSFSLFTGRIKEEIQLVVAGIRGENLPFFKRIAQELGVDKKVLFPGYVAGEDIPFLFNGAEFFVFIPLYEGFGLPLVDAMACECPIIASDVTSIPEIAKDVAVLVNPYDINQIAEAMVTLFGNTQLKEELIRKGRERVKQFSWEKTVRKTIQVYKEALRK